MTNWGSARDARAPRFRELLSKAETTPVATTAARNGPKARMWRLLLKEAGAMLCDGETPSVAEVAARAGVSRATAYRYFPSRSKLINAVVEDSLGPVRRLASTTPDWARAHPRALRPDLSALQGI